MSQNPETPLSPERKVGGILTPLSALRGAGDLGVGDTAALVEFVEWAARNGFGLVQILPVNETEGDNSPYNIISSIACDPTTITTTPEWIPDLSQEDFDAITGRHDLAGLRDGPVRYAEVKALKKDLLLAGFRNFRSRGGGPARVRELARFETAEAAWLEPYSFFRALVEWNGGGTGGWPPEHRSPTAALAWKKTLPPPAKRRFQKWVRFFRYVQWIAHMQWMVVREACEKQGVLLMGDIPVGVSISGADVWAEPEIFDLTFSSGAPPERVFKGDLFLEKWGQNWGFPLYNWQAMSRDNFAWWRRRLRIACRTFHLLRVDHALGFFRIYSFPWRPGEDARFANLSQEEARALTGGRLPGFSERDDGTEENREMNRRRGEMLLRVFLEETGPHRLVAEDLGEVAPYVRPVLADLGLAGMKIPQWERGMDGRMIPGADYQRLSLATFATHDHPPLRQMWDDWFSAASAGDDSSGPQALHAMREMLEFCGRPEIPLPQPFTREIHAALVRGLFATNAWLAVHQITDLFGLADRFNTPGAVGGANWTTRISGKIPEWTMRYPEAIASASLALRETGRAAPAHPVFFV